MTESPLTEARAGSPGAKGEVWLVGAGPGDPGLLTVRGRELLAEADVVVTDRLAAGVLLDLVRPDAEIIHVGKSPRGRSLDQDEVNALLVERALAGRRVVRLKGGDPFLLGRGSEEAEACAAAGVPCTVVPGVTSALAAPAYAGIPVTHRDLAQSVVIVSGHLPPGHPHSKVDWAALAASQATIVVLMGVARLIDIVDALLEGGRPPDTPVAVIERGTTPAQRVLRTTLDALSIDAIAFRLRSPAVTVIGEVAAREDAPVLLAGGAGGSAGSDSESESRADEVGEAAGRSPRAAPLAGVRVLVPRTRRRPGLLARRLRALGADAVEVTVAQLVPVDDPQPLVRALAGADALVLADADEVRAVVALLRRAGTDVRALAGMALVAASAEAADALDALGLAGIRWPEPAPAVSDGRAEAEFQVVVAASAAHPAGVRETRRVTLLADAPAEADRRIAEELRHGDFDVVAFASSTAARCTAELYGPLPANLLVAAMGRHTAQACEAAGLRVDVVPPEPGIHPLAAAVADLVDARRAVNGR